MIFNQVDKIPAQLDLLGIVRMQIAIHCFLNDILLTKTELDCLALLGCRGRMRLNKFCALAAEVGVLGSSTAVNNCLARVEKSRLFLKEGAGKKHILLNPELGIQTTGNIILNYKFVSVNEQAGTLEGVSHENGGATITA